MGVNELELRIKDEKGELDRVELEAEHALELENQRRALAKEKEAKAAAKADKLAAHKAAQRAKEDWALGHRHVDHVDKEKIVGIVHNGAHSTYKVQEASHTIELEESKAAPAADAPAKAKEGVDGWFFGLFGK